MKEVEQEISLQLEKYQYHTEMIAFFLSVPHHRSHMHPYPETYTILDGKDYAAHAAFIKEIWVELKKKKVNQQKKKSRKEISQTRRKEATESKKQDAEGSENQKM